LNFLLFFIVLFATAGLVKKFRLAESHILAILKEAGWRHCRRGNTQPYNFFILADLSPSDAEFFPINGVLHETFQITDG
jgi:hypothetical protein